MENFYKQNWLSYAKRFALFVAMTFAGSTAFAQMSGSYTIDDGSATGGTNFASFSDFATAITSAGVNGPVTVDVVSGSGPYYENVTFSAITGASSTNTITINGNGSMIAATGAVITLSGADYMTFDDLVVNATGTGTNTRCFWIYNNSDYNTISNCDIQVTEYTGTGSGTGYIMFTSSSTSYTSNGYHGVGTVITGNKMWNGDSTGAGPYNGVTDYRNSTNGVNVNLVLDDNEISDVYYYSTYFYYSKDATVTNNDFHTRRYSSSNTTSFVLYNYYGGTIKYEGNEIHDFDAYYNYVSYIYQCSGTSGNPSTYSNNNIHDLSGYYNYGNRDSS